MLAVLLAILLGTTPLSDVQKRRIAGLGPLPPPPADPTNAASRNPEAARLGQYLFFDKGLSRTGTVSCGTCHVAELGFADGRSLPMGLAPGVRHAPSLLNVAHHRWFFWDGRADTLWSQALHPFEQPTEFDSSRLAALHHIADNPEVRTAYERIFGPLPPLEETNRFPRSAHPGTDADDPAVAAWNRMTDADRTLVNRAFSNIGKAIAAYEHQLATPPSPFDQYVTAMLAEDDEGMTSLSPAAQRGLLLFIGEAGCRQCHNGPLLSDREFHNIGVPPLGGGLPQDSGRWGGVQRLQDDPFRASGVFSDAPESGRGRATQTLARNQDHWGAFRTPSLRNLALTAPYMHQGQFQTLAEVLRYYNTLETMVVLDHHQETVLQPLRLSAEQLNDLEAFLLSLSGPPVPEVLGRQPGSPLREEKQH